MDFYVSSIIFFLFLFLGTATGEEGGGGGGRVEITYGTLIKLKHERTSFRLHSHDLAYGSGSGQQSVTGFPDVDDANSYWIVRPQLDSSAKQGDIIPRGTIIRLQHMTTRRWLHSHLHASPISGELFWRRW
ncbi:Stromal cell-derived factor 2-like protein [Apostasia shenzhenica]|uniref:Stromal cell-derived factor 2-like protein n=1 Tax=Apostasia shenzhenica TaxID=1088818 RepID=A0A2H9ZYD4_9ASPA|nr:Stromal cell-derived factor 2-like protein [Apostasia shenzhenica]